MSDRWAGLFFRFMQCKVEHMISDKAAAAMWSFIMANHEVVGEAIQESGRAPLYSTVKTSVLDDVPIPLLDVCHKNLESEELIYDTNLREFPWSKYRSRKWQTEWENWNISLQSVLDMHLRNPNHSRPNEVDFSIDGIAMSKSGGKSMDIVSVTFPECRNVYIVKTIITRKKRKYEKAKMKLMNVVEELAQYMVELNTLGIKLRRVVCDGPKRYFGTTFTVFIWLAK